MPQAWTNSELKLLEHLRPVCTTREIAEIFKLSNYERSLEAISRQGRKNNWKFMGLGEPNWNKLNKENQEHVSHVILKRHGEIEKRLTPSQKSQVGLKINKQSCEILNRLESISKTTASKTKYIKPIHGGLSLVALLSDFHIGKVVKDSTSEVSYNTEIGIERIYQTVDLIQQSTNEEVDELVVNLAGDHVDGEGVYPGQDVTLEVDVATQVFRTTEAIWKMLTDLRSIYPKVRVVAVRGNHGRTKLSREANFDTMLLQSLKLISEIAQSDIHIDFQYGEYNTCEVQGWKLLTRHYAPKQADTPSAISRFAGWHDMHDYDILTYGHFHHWGVFSWNDKVIIRNGSLVGGDSYGEEFGSCDSPVQVAFGVTPEERISFIKPMIYE